jgi:polyphosphate kinase
MENTDILHRGAGPAEDLTFDRPTIEMPTSETTPSLSATAPFNRELSWIEFNRRVLEEALDRRNPLLERVKFLSIFFSNLDEFFMIRVGGIKHQIAARVDKKSPDGFTPFEQLVAVHGAIRPLLEQARSLLLDDLVPALKEQGVALLHYPELSPTQREKLSEYFHSQVFPVLTPLAFDPSHPFPHISNLSLNLAVIIRDGPGGELFARVKIPEVLPRFVPLPLDAVAEAPMEPGVAVGPMAPRRFAFIWLEDLISAHLPRLFPGMEVVESFSFRVTRNADLDIEEDEAGDLLRTIEEGVRQRRFGEAVRLQVDAAMPERIRTLVATNLDLEAGDIDTVRGPQGLAELAVLRELDRPDLKDPSITPNLPVPVREPADLFAVIRQQDILLHHPYDSFAPVVHFIQTAAVDPNVLAIKQTLYRVGTNSPVVDALMTARERGKQVTVLVELKARFDEEKNITWARALERAGVHVVYGLVGLKTHAKIALVVRKEQDVIRRYVHLGTGNYNVGTARIYTDLGLLTAREDFGVDASELFNYLTGHSRQSAYRKLFVAPVTLRTKLHELIEREIAVQNASGTGRLIFKVNSLVDTQIIQELYRASQAGVQVDLIVRGMCCLRPGVPDLSERIRVRSIVGPYLEHSRVFYFGNGGQDEVYLGTYLRDNHRAWILRSDGRYDRLTPANGEPVVDSQRFASP